MTREISIGLGSKSTREQLAEFEPEDLFGQLEKDNLKLGELGVTTPIHLMDHGAARFGWRYEDTADPRHTTPLNFLAALTNSDPDLRKRLSDRDYLRLFGVISRIAMCVDELSRKMGQFSWPETLKRDPTSVLAEKNT